MEPWSRDPVRDGRALREVAKLANAQPVSKSPPKKPNADHSGVVDLAALMAEQPNWLDGAVARAKSAATVTLTPPVISPGSLAPTMLTGVGEDEIPLGVPRARSTSLVLASAGAGLLVAAACVFAVRASHPAASAPPPPPAQAMAVAHVDAPAIPPIPPPPAADPAGAQAAGAEAPPADDVQGSAATTAATDPSTSHPADADRHHGHRGHHDRSADSTAFAAPAKEAPAPARQASPPHVGSALDSALRAAAGPAAAPSPAAAAPAPVAAKSAPAPAADGRPERPSGSAVTSALTEVLPAARRCVASMTDASRALVTFGSDGAVHKVDVTGPAGSDARAGQCLRAAFGHAHVPPFSQSSYAAGVTVRPQ
jgi:hypothetical protein